MRSNFGAPKINNLTLKQTEIFILAVPILKHITVSRVDCISLEFVHD